SITCKGTHKIKQADLDAGKFDDTACTSATGGEEACATVKVPGTKEPKLSITKDASPKTFSKLGEVISYTIVATNTGNVTLNNVSVEDKPALEGFSCSPAIPATLAPGESITCKGTHKIKQADLDAGKFDDTACTSATGAEEKCATVKVPGTKEPGLSITKEASPKTFSKLGEVITYTIVATNT